MTPIFACLCALSLASASFAQVTSDSIHEIEVRIKAGGGQVSGVRVRLVRQSGMMLVAESFSSQEGQVRFSKLMPGEYIVETAENERFEATTTSRLPGSHGGRSARQGDTGCPCRRGLPERPSRRPAPPSRCGSPSPHDSDFSRSATNPHAESSANPCRQPSASSTHRRYRPC